MMAVDEVGHEAHEVDAFVSGCQRGSYCDADEVAAGVEWVGLES